jgi:hypothetical protein
MRLSQDTFLVRHATSSRVISESAERHRIHLLLLEALICSAAMVGAAVAVLQHLS